MTEIKIHITKLMQKMIETNFKLKKPVVSIEKLQKQVLDEFDKFWKKKENRIDNEKNGYLDKVMYNSNGKSTIRMPRDKQNRFKSECCIDYLKYTDDVIIKIIKLVHSKMKKTRIKQYFDEININIPYGFITLVEEVYLQTVPNKLLFNDAK